MKIGDPITFVDSERNEHPALVTQVWGDDCVNLVFVSVDENRTDQYGRQLERRTSVVNVRCQVSGNDQPYGNVWK